MKLSKLNRLFLSASIPTLGLASCSLLASCNQSTKCTVNYDCDSYINWTSKPTEVDKGKDFTATYTLSTDTVNINTSRCFIYVNNVDIKNKTGVTYSGGTIYIPSSLITGTITICLRTQEKVTYNIKFDANGGYFGSTSTTTKTISITTALLYNSSCPIPSHTDSNKIFNGWYTDSTCSTSASFPCDASTITTLYAGWTDTSSYGSFDPTKEECFKGDGVTYDSATTDYYLFNVTSSANGDPTATLSGSITKPIVFKCETKNINLTLNLNGIKITASDTTDAYAPITIMKGTQKYGSVTINAMPSTANIITDNRSTLGDYDACINSQAPITNITGAGAIKISTSKSEGIRAKGDGILNIKQSTLYVDAYDTAIRGNAGISISDGANVTVYSKAGDGLKTKDAIYSSTSSTDRYGNISIADSTVTISSAGDAIDAAYDVNIYGINTVVDISTGKYSQYGTSYATVDSDDFFIRTNASTYPHSSFVNKYYFDVVFSDDEGLTNTETDQATLKKITSGSAQPGGGGSSTTYNYYKASRPIDSAGTYKYAFIYIYDATTADSKSKKPLAKSSAISISSPKAIATQNGMTISSYTIGTEDNPGTIKMASETYNYKNAIGSESSSKVAERGITDYSSKGIKCGNSINLKNGSTTLKTSDDAIHGGYGTRFAPGLDTTTQPFTVGSGNVNISGGNLVITYTADDAIHADNTLTISGGNTIVTNSYEAVEAGIINISGGKNWIFAEDDAINAAECGPVVTNCVTLNVTGGQTFANAYGGDVDAIDSNNTMTISGGELIAMGGSSNSGGGSQPGKGGGGQPGGTSTAIDVEKSITHTGGVLVAIGKVENEDSKLSYQGTKYTLASSISSATTYKLNWSSFEEFVFTTQFAYSSSVYAWAQTKPSLTK